jgi:DNA-binding PadR family transcriptional regulator
MVERGRKPMILTPAGVHILLSLADGNRYGLEIVEEVEERTGGEVKLGPGTLYGAIKRLRAAGLIRDSLPSPGHVPTDSRLRVYRITDPGRIALRKEAMRLEAIVSTARLKAVLGPVEGK